MRMVAEDGLFLVAMILFHLTVILQWWHLESASVAVWTDYAICFAKSVFHVFPSLFLVLCIAFLIRLIPFQGLRRFLQIVIASFSAIIFICDLFLLYTYQDLLDQSKIEIVLGTNPNTVFAFLSVYVFRFHIIFCIFIAVLIFLSILYLGKKCLLLWKENHPASLLFLAAVALYSFLIVSGKACWDDYQGNIPSVEHAKSLTLVRIFYLHTPLGRFCMDLDSALSSLGNEGEIYAVMDEQKERILENNSSIPNVIFILGESTDRNRMSLYGYHLENNPLLKEREAKGELAVFRDVISCGNWTSAVMELLFTFAEKGHDRLWYEYANLFDILDSAGYRTVWISNQSTVGWSGNLDKIYSERCQERDFSTLQGGQSGSWKHYLDDVLFSFLDARMAMEESKGKNFYVVHLMGTHAIYEWRYPQEYRKFHAPDERGENLTQQEVQADYDNAVLYNDYIVDEIIRRFEQENAIVFYLSDHGEEIYDGRDFCGHSSEEHGNRHMIEIPFLVWMSPEFRRAYPEIVQRVHSAVERPYRTDALIHTLLDVMQIRTEHFDSSRSLFSPDFEVRERIYNGKPYQRM